MNTNDITLSQLTAATVTTGKVVNKLYQEQAEQLKRLDHVTELVEEMATQTHSVDVTPIVENLDAMRTEQVGAIESVADIVKPMLGAQADVKETVKTELATVKDVMQKLALAMNRIGDAVQNISENQQKLNDKLNEMERRVASMDESLAETTLQMTETKESTIETAARVKTLGVQVSGLMLSNSASEEDLISLMSESTAMLEEEQ